VSDNEPQFEVVGHREGDHIVWHDGSEPTPVPEDLRGIGGDAACTSEEEQ
jgi:hypothetical protein